MRSVSARTVRVEASLCRIRLNKADPKASKMKNIKARMMIFMADEGVKDDSVYQPVAKARTAGLGAYVRGESLILWSVDCAGQNFSLRVV